MEPSRISFPPARTPVRSTPPWLLIGCYFLASRLYIFVIGIMSVHVIAQGPDVRSMAPLDLFNNWDTHYYVDIARAGYPEHGNSTAFFPLYPLAIHLGCFLVHDPRIVGYVISNLLLLASCLLLWKLAARDYGREDVADRAVVFLLFCPVSFFFSTIYTESLFLFLMLATVYLAGERRWLAAGGCGYLLALTRPVGILMAVVLAAEFATVFLRDRKLAGKAALRLLPQNAPPFLASVCLTGAGLGSYCLYLWHRFGNPFDFVRAERNWNRHFAFPWGPFERFYYAAFYDVWFDAAVVTAVVVLIFGFTFRLRVTHLVLGVVYLLFYLSTVQLESVPRFLSVLFPFYIIIAMVAVRRPRLEPLLLAGSAMLLTLSTVLFVNGYWFT